MKSSELPGRGYSNWDFNWDWKVNPGTYPSLRRGEDL